jgi:signal transduction histidine kinase
MELYEKLPRDTEELMAELEEARETLRALKFGQVDALVVTDPASNDYKIFALQGSQKIAQSIFEQSAEAIVVCDSDGTITKASEAAHEICGLNPILQPFEHVFPLRLPDSRLHGGAKYFALNEILAGKAVRGLEVEFNSLKNEHRTFLLSAAPLQNGAPPIQGCIVMLTDITAQKKAQDELRAAVERETELRMQLQQSAEIREQFLAVISHELRTPLMAILGWAQILQRHDDSDPERVQKGLKTIERNAHHQARIVDDLLDMSRIVSGKLRLEISRVNVNRLIGDLVETMRPAAENKNITLRFDACENEIFVNADGERLQQVIGNLIGNAVKFTPQNGTVSISVVRTGGHVEISVGDSGIGIDPEFLPHVFDPFRQADASTSRKRSGLGLGLAIVRSLVELHQGTVSAHSEGLGKGATFTVRIALAARVTG